MKLHNKSVKLNIDKLIFDYFKPSDNPYTDKLKQLNNLVFTG